MDKISTIKENILYFIDYQGIKKEDFYKKTGIASSNFKGSGMKSEIGGDKIVKILTAYPILNAEWLITGKGEMIKKGKENEELYKSRETLINELKLKEEIIVLYRDQIEFLKSQLVEKIDKFPTKEIYEIHELTSRNALVEFIKSKKTEPKKI